jgi:hypothetical protein
MTGRSLDGAEAKSGKHCAPGVPDCAEPVIGPATSGRTRWLHAGYKTSGSPQNNLWNLKIPIDVIPILLYIFRVLFDEELLSRSDPFSGQSES